MFFKKKKKFYNIMTTIQNTLGCLTIIMALVLLFDKELYIQLTVMLSLFLIVLGFNNYKFYKVKYLSVFAFLLSIFLLLGVII